jgi:hypothetical protein
LPTFLPLFLIPYLKRERERERERRREGEGRKDGDISCKS